MGIQAEPSAMYGDGARALQDTFDSRRLADVLVRRTLHEELTDADIELITDQSAVWISTVDAEGWPDVSYKGGAPGFITVVGRSELRLPSYDGNGMFRTFGNVVDTGRVAMLFFDDVRARRLRVHGTAVVSTDAADVAAFHGAHAVMIITIGRLFPNCGRYIHTDGPSVDVPAPGHTPPTPAWKHYPELQAALPHDQQNRAVPDEH